MVDEYYFWFNDGKWFDGQEVITTQNADLGVKPPGPTSSWDRLDRLQPLLH